LVLPQRCLQSLDAPLGKPPLFVRAGAAVPLLPEGVDTLVAASEPGVVTAASVATQVAAHLAVRGDASLGFDGGALSVRDAAAVRIEWAPASAPVARATVDMGGRSGGATTASQVTSSAGSIARVADEAAVAGCAGSCYAVSADGRRVWLRLAGAQGVEIK
jgi:hypothetical protein